MLNSAILDIIISLIFVYFLFSTFVSVFQEVYASRKKERGKFLKESIQDVFNDSLNKNFGDLLYTNASISFLGRKKTRLPSYVDGKEFSNALIQQVINEGLKDHYFQDSDGKVQLEEKSTENDSYIQFINGINELNQSNLKQLLSSFLIDDHGSKSINQVKVNISQWYDSYMNRVGGWYKRKVRISLFWKSILVIFLFNINFFSILQTLYTNTVLRDAVVKKAEFAIAQNPQSEDVQKELKKLFDFGLPMGWNLGGLNSFESSVNDPIGYTKDFFKWSNMHDVIANIHFQIRNSGGYVYSLIGWLISSYIISFGASFWFSILKKIINVRQTGLTAHE